MRPQPVVCAWLHVEVVDEDGVARDTKALVPVGPYAAVADGQFGAPGTQHIIEQSSPRNMRFHSKYFAMVHEYFHQLPEEYAGRWEDSDHLRLYILIHKTRWFTEVEADLDKGESIHTSGPYVWIYRRGNKVIVRSAQSQSLKSMGKKDFEKSAEDVLEVLAQMVGIPVSQMGKEAGRSA